MTIKKPVRNPEIRERIKTLGIPTFILAEMFGVSEPTIYRWLRDESDEMKNKLNTALDDVEKQNAEFNKMVTDSN